MILIAYIVFIILILIGLGWLKQRASQRTLTRDFNAIFEKSNRQRPTLKIGSSYSWPTFDITFQTKEDLEFAETSGLVNQFKNKISRRYTKDFDPDRAVYCTYVGHIPNWKVIFEEKNETNQNKL